MDINAATNLALELMNKHGLLAKGWRLEFDSARKRFGCCSHWRKKITLSRALVEINNIIEVQDTILHEIAHALVDSKEHHGPVWKAKAREIGARPERCYSTENAATLTFEWRGVCPFCKGVWTYIRSCNVCRDGKTCVCFMSERARALAAGQSFSIRRHTVRFKKFRTIVVPPGGRVMGTFPKLIEGPAPVMQVEIPAPQPVTVTPPEIRQAIFGGVNFDAARCVELYKSGKRVVDIAVAMGYNRGHGQNRVRAALVKAGVYKVTPVDYKGEN